MTYNENGGGDPFNSEFAFGAISYEALTPEQQRLLTEAAATIPQIQTEEQCLAVFELTETIQGFAPEAALLMRLEGVGQLFFSENPAPNPAQRERIEHALLENMQQTATQLGETPNAALQDITAQALMAEIARRARKATITTPIILEDGTLIDHTTKEVDREAIDSLAELGLALRLNSGALAWHLASATRVVQEDKRRDILAAQEAYDLRIDWSELPSLLTDIQIRVEQGLSYSSQDPIGDILLDTYLFFVADKENGIAIRPEKPIQEIIEELTEKGENQNENEQLFVSFATGLKQWHVDWMVSMSPLFILRPKVPDIKGVTSTVII